MGSVFQVKSGPRKDQWRGNANLPKVWDDRKGKWKYPLKTIYGIDARDVRRKVNEIENKVFKNKYADDGRITLNSYLDNWINEYCDNPDLASTTKELYKMYVDVHIKPAIGHILMRDILPSTINQFYNKLKRGGQTYKNSRGKIITRKPLMDKTISKIHSILSRALKDAVDNKLIYDNPCNKAKKLKREQYKPQVYNEEQMQKLLSIVAGTFDEICIVLGAVCSFRRGEVFGIRPRYDIDFTKRLIRISETKVRFSKWTIKEPKSESSKRVNKVPKFVIDIIKNYLSTLKVIPEYLCDKYKPDSYSKHFKKLLEDNNLPHIRFHDLRHFTGSIAAKYNVPITAIQDYMGHADKQTTGIYMNNLSDMNDFIPDVMEKIFNKK